MYYWNRDGISVRVVLDKRQVLKSGLYPIHIRVIYRRVIKDYSAGKQSSVSDWDKLFTSNAQSFARIRNFVKERFETVVGIADDLANRQEFSLPILKAKYREATSPSFKIDGKV